MISCVLSSLLVLTVVPPNAIPPEMLDIRACGESKKLKQLLPALLYFVDVGSEYSELQLDTLADIASPHNLQVVGALSFSRHFDTTSPCKSMDAYPGVTLLDDRADADERPPSLNKALNMHADDVAIFDKNGALFRYIPRHKSTLRRKRMFAWVQTMVEEFAAVQADPKPQASPLFLERTFDRYIGMSVFDLDSYETQTDVDTEDCEDHCLDVPGCTGFVTWGLHECTYFIDEPIVLYASRRPFPNSNLFLRQVHADVRAYGRIKHAFSLAFGIFFSAAVLYFICSKISRRRNVTLASQIQADESPLEDHRDSLFHLEKHLYIDETNENNDPGSPHGAE